MKRMSWRAVLLLILGLLIAVMSAGCTLTGAPAAPPADTAVPTVEESGITQLPLPTTQAPPSPTKLIVVGSPTPVATLDIFATVTAGAQNTPGGAAGTPSVGVATATPPLGAGVTTPAGTARPGTPASVAGGTGGCPPTYTVQSGDNLFRIALRFNLTVAQLASANGIANPEFIVVGTVLKIPGCGGGAANPTPRPVGTAVPSGSAKPQAGDTVASNGDILHTVKSGENLYRIALAYGLSWQAVATYNGITAPDQIVVGQVIRIPTK
jgi:LysM repeat protein